MIGSPAAGRNSASADRRRSFPCSRTISFPSTSTETREQHRPRERPMEFGYFTLSDNHYENNTRAPNQFIGDITAEALHADKLGMHSAWIGEHHFNSLGVLSCPDLTLAYIAAQTRHIRLAPAVTLPSFSKPSIELAARLDCGLIVAPFAAAMSYGGLRQVADLYNESCARFGHQPGRLMCSYFTHFADTKEQETAQRARQIRYYKECVIPALPGDPKTAPPSYRYFIDMVDRLHKVRPEDLTENSVLLGSPARITETLKKVEAAGFSEVILYFNVGLKPHAQVKEEMDRFMREVAPAFDGAHRRQAA